MLISIPAVFAIAKMCNTAFVDPPITEFGIVKESDINNHKKNTIYYAIKNKLICNYGDCPIYERKLKKTLNKWNNLLYVMCLY